MAHWGCHEFHDLCFSPTVNVTHKIWSILKLIAMGHLSDPEKIIILRLKEAFKSSRSVYLSLKLPVSKCI